MVLDGELSASKEFLSHSVGEVVEDSVEGAHIELGGHTTGLGSDSRGFEDSILDLLETLELLGIGCSAQGGTTKQDALEHFFYD